MDPAFRDFLAVLLAFVQALIPAALGAAVSQSFKKGLSWGERVLQWLVGICVSYFMTRAIGGIAGAIEIRWLADPFVIQAIGFVVAMIAFEAAPKFIRGASDTLGDLPGKLAGRILPKKDG